MEYTRDILRNRVREYLDKYWKVNYFEDPKGFLMVVYTPDSPYLRYYIKRIFIQEDAILFENLYPIGTMMENERVSKNLFRLMNQINSFASLGKLLVDEDGSISYVTILKCSLQTPTMRVIDSYFVDSLAQHDLILSQLNTIFFEGAETALI